MVFLKNHIIREDLEEIFNRDIDWEQFRNKTILITGAYGMLASYIVFVCIFLNEVYSYGIRIIAAVRHGEKLYERFGEYADRPYFIKYLDDITEPFHVEGDVDYMIHAAGLASMQHYLKNPIDVMLPNVLGTIQLLKLATQKRSKGFLLFSSGEVYGRIEKEISVINEDTYGWVNTLELRNCYCESKRAAEMLCCAWHAQEGVPAKIARICHTFGPTMDIERDNRVFASFASDVLHNRNIVVESDGSAKRPFTYIADAVAGYFTILLYGKNGTAYNVCNEKEFLSIRQLAEAAASIYPQMGLKVEIKNRISQVKNETENEIKISSEKLKKLGWECYYDINKSLYRTIEGIREERI